MKGVLAPEKQERLLELADGLVAKLVEVPIHLVAGGKGEAEELGVPASCVGHAASFLYRHRDQEQFKSFVQRLDRLDAMTGQNLQNPRAHHSALREILRPWLETHSDLSADECLYVLSWVRRLLPKDSKTAKPPNRYERSRRETRGGQMLNAFKRAQDRAPAPEGPQKEVWDGAIVSYDAGGGGIVRAVATDRRRAEARQDKARKVIKAMNGDARQRLVERRKSLTTDVEVEKVGASWHILSVRS